MIDRQWVASLGSDGEEVAYTVAPKIQLKTDTVNIYELWTSAGFLHQADCHSYTTVIIPSLFHCCTYSRCLFFFKVLNIFHIVDAIAILEKNHFIEYCTQNT